MVHSHGLTGYKLSRKSGPRRALIAGLSRSLVISEKVVTTKPKAKAFRPQFEKLITRAKQPSLHSRRQLMQLLRDEEVVNKLLEDLGKRFAKRAGGYTRMKAAGWRTGDNAELVEVTLTEQPPNPAAAGEAKPESKPAKPKQATAKATSKKEKPDAKS